MSRTRQFLGRARAVKGSIMQRLGRGTGEQRPVEADGRRRRNMGDWKATGGKVRDAFRR